MVRGVFHCFIPSLNALGIQLHSRLIAYFTSIRLWFSLGRCFNVFVGSGVGFVSEETSDRDERLDTALSDEQDEDSAGSSSDEDDAEGRMAWLAGTGMARGQGNSRRDSVGDESVSDSQHADPSDESQLAALGGGWIGGARKGRMDLGTLSRAADDLWGDASSVVSTSSSSPSTSDHSESTGSELDSAHHSDKNQGGMGVADGRSSFHEQLASPSSTNTGTVAETAPPRRSRASSLDATPHHSVRSQKPVRVAARAVKHTRKAMRRASVTSAHQAADLAVAAHRAQVRTLTVAEVRHAAAQRERAVARERHKRQQLASKRSRAKRGAAAPSTRSRQPVFRLGIREVPDRRPPSQQHHRAVQTMRASLCGLPSNPEGKRMRRFEKLVQ